jgi:NAD(P)H-hydrate repair Nnr-like enzyme with NAD(P)H-hydrate dehydratase domain
MHPKVRSMLLRNNETQQTILRSMLTFMRWTDNVVNGRARGTAEDMDERMTRVINRIVAGIDQLVADIEAIQHLANAAELDEVLAVKCQLAEARESLVANLPGE